MSTGEIRDQTPCRECGYDLRGLTPDGLCPECGKPIALTVPPCPRCLLNDDDPVALTRLPSSSIGTWSCERCAGIGFEKNRLREIAAHLERPKFAPAKAVYDLVAQSAVTCTRCRIPMESIVIDTATLIDRCRHCGMIWLDFGELKPLAAYLRRNLGDAPPPRNLEEMLGNPKALREAVEGSSLTSMNSPSERSIAETIAALVLVLIFGA
jgi:Zn-finger nucleic acid-binding protein